MSWQFGIVRQPQPPQSPAFSTPTRVDDRLGRGVSDRASEFESKGGAATATQAETLQWAPDRAKGADVIEIAERDVGETSRSILVVEDDEPYAFLIHGLLAPLSMEGYRIDHVATLGEAVDALNSQNVGCVLLDLGLPDGGGLYVVSRLLEVAPELPVVVLTGLADQEVAMTAVQSGAQDFLIKGSVDSDLLVRTVRYSIERKRLENELAHQALHDALTGLPNRALLLDRLEVALARSDRHDGALAVLFLDLDDFKVVNDSLGHAAGDDLLRQVAERLTTAVRESDTVARLGGDEFVVLFDELESRQRVSELGVRVKQAMSRTFDILGREVFVSCSIGIAVSEDAEGAPQDLLRNADAAMYRAKAGGRARTEVFDSSMHALAVERLDAQGALRSATRSDFRLVFQPIVDLQSGTVVAFEGLLRWNHPQKGIVDPATFVPLAEETGMIATIGGWVLEHACRQCVEWNKRAVGSPIGVSINLSPYQLTEESLVPLAKAAMETAGLPRGLLTLELTESTLMSLDDRTVATLNDLKRLGIRLALDDFGTGYSSLSYLQQFPIDIVKIDRSFVRDITESSKQSAYTRAIVTLGQTLQLVTIAEGIERADQAAELKSAGCDQGQGFHFARPMEQEEVAEFLQIRNTPL